MSIQNRVLISIIGIFKFDLGSSEVSGENTHQIKLSSGWNRGLDGLNWVEESYFDRTRSVKVQK